MKRTNIRIPDAINKSSSKNFTQIPNDLLRNPNISGKAKALLCLLLSNKDGWHSYITTIKQMMKEGEDAIRSGIEELEEHRYLVRIRYREIKTKVWRGQFWIYTDTPGVFSDLSETIQLLEDRGLEIVLPENPHVENPDVGSPDVENPGLIILSNKKTNDKNINPRAEADKKVRKSLFGSPIVPSQFDQFWSIYPKKVSKGAALTAWEKICNKEPKNRPTWNELKKAIKAQKESEQWQDKKFIPYPSTWLNQKRWLDDPKEMKSFKRNVHAKPTTGHYEPDYKFREDDMTL